MTTFKVGDLVVRKPEYINKDSPWERDCLQKGLDPFAPTKVRAVNTWGIQVESPDTATWVVGYFNHYVPLDRPLEDYM